MFGTIRTVIADFVRTNFRVNKPHLGTFSIFGANRRALEFGSEQLSARSIFYLNKLENPMLTFVCRFHAANDIEISNTLFNFAI